MSGFLVFRSFFWYGFSYLLKSGVEERYLGRLITSRPGFDSRPRNKLEKTTDEAVFSLREGIERRTEALTMESRQEVLSERIAADFC